MTKNRDESHVNRPVDVRVLVLVLGFASTSATSAVRVAADHAPVRRYGTGLHRSTYGCVARLFDKQTGPHDGPGLAVGVFRVYIMIQTVAVYINSLYHI